MSVVYAMSIMAARDMIGTIHTIYVTYLMHVQSMTLITPDIRMSPMLYVAGMKDVMPMMYGSYMAGMMDVVWVIYMMYMMGNTYVTCNMGSMPVMRRMCVVNLVYRVCVARDISCW